MAAQTEYLNRIQSYDNAVVGRVKTLRNEVQSSVGRLTATQRKIEGARDSIAATEQEVAAAKEAAEARFAELQTRPGGAARNDELAGVQGTGAERQPLLDLRTDRRRSAPQKRRRPPKPPAWSPKRRANSRRR